MNWRLVTTLMQTSFFLARVPRIILAALTGAALSVAGAVLQSLLRNDLAAPFTLGVSSGAALGAVIAISAGLPYTVAGMPTVPIAAFLGALGAITLVFSLARTRTGEFPTAVLFTCRGNRKFLFRGLGHADPLPIRLHAIIQNCPLADGRARYHKLYNTYIHLSFDTYWAHNTHVY